MTSAIAGGFVPAVSPLPALSAVEERAVRHALGPDERVLAWLRGTDARGATLWIATSRRLLMLSREALDAAVSAVSWPSLTRVTLRTDPFGAMLLVRATGRQLAVGALDARAGAAFAAVLEARAGLASDRTMAMPLATDARRASRSVAR